MKKYIINKHGNLELHFVSPINVDNGFVNHYLGMFESTMELFKDKNDTPMMIEWIVSDKDGNIRDIQTIGLIFENKELIDYDGVFELPIQAINLIKKSGYKVSDDFNNLKA